MGGVVKRYGVLGTQRNRFKGTEYTQTSVRRATHKQRNPLVLQESHARVRKSRGDNVIWDPSLAAGL